MSQQNLKNALINWDLVTVNPKNKNWDWKDLFCFWGVSIQSTIGFSLIASLYIVYDLNTFVVLFGTIIGSLLVCLFSNLIGKPSQKFGLPFIVLLRSSLGIYGIIVAGWSSNSRYAFLGSLRSAAQMISYEVSIGLIIISVLLSSGSLNLTDIVMSQQKMWYVIPHFPMFVIFFISTLAETNRAPFDLPEAESELVAGYNVEYSSMSFGLFFLGEYGNMILMSSMSTILFLGGWLPPFESQYFDLIPGYLWFLMKVVSLLFVFLWVRATLPRYRYDQLMTLGWKLFLPLSLLWIIITSSFMFFSEYV